MLKKALQIAIKAHGNTLDKGGELYFLHPIRVAFGLKTEDEQVVALLHDVVEDTEYTLVDLIAELDLDLTNMEHQRILVALYALIREQNVSYSTYINRLLKFDLYSKKVILAVKIKDLEDNMNLDRISNPQQVDFDRVKKYKKYHTKLTKEYKLLYGGEI